MDAMTFTSVCPRCRTVVTDDHCPRCEQAMIRESVENGHAEPTPANQSRYRELSAA